MKRLRLFYICILSLFFVFEALLYANKLGSFGAWASAHDIYISLFVVLSILSLTGIGYFKYRKAKAAQGREVWVAGNLIMKKNIKKIKKNVWRDTVPLMIFLLCTQIVTFSHWDKSLKLLLTIGLTVIFMVVVAFLNWTVRRNYKLGIEKAIQYEENVSLKLRSIRSQLNPHFMFNALTSIQNLMNKNDIPAANHYLSLFADLTRKVLNTSDQELISLADELQIQEDYLQMEQLRFGFKYEIKVDEAINLANTEIPAMLLQPFAENAVKHGVAPLQQGGTIQVQVDKQGNDLVLSITDNGKGFDKNTIQNNTNSLGLKLSEERIMLLNELHKEQLVILSIDSRQTGTRITLLLKNLFL